MDIRLPAASFSQKLKPYSSHMPMLCPNSCAWTRAPLPSRPERLSNQLPAFHHRLPAGWPGWSLTLTSPPELTKEQEKAFKDSIKDLKPKEKKDRTKVFKDERVTVVERQALVARHKYVVSRLHYRYDAKGLPNDPQIGSAAAASGGTAQPKGKDGDASTEIKSGDGNRLQIRYNNFHPWLPVIECRDADRYKWGKAGRDVHILRKTWIADDLTRKSHTQIKPDVVVKTPIPDLGLGIVAKPVQPSGAGGSGGSSAGAAAGKSSCSVRVAGDGRGEATRPSAALALLGLLMASRARGRRRRIA